MKYLRTFNENTNYYVVRESKNYITWFVDNKRCGVFQVSIIDDNARIVGYMKDNKSVDGYQFIKLSIDCLLSDSINSITSYGNRSEHAAKVWERLSNEDKYNVKTIDRTIDGYIPNRHSIKILTRKSEKKINENNNNMSKRLIKKLSTEQVNNFTETEANQFLISYGDGQGDTYLRTLTEFCKYKEPEYTPMDMINGTYEEVGGNMVNLAWIENNKLMDIVFTD